MNTFFSDSCEHFVNLSDAVGAAVAVQVLDLEVWSSNPMLSTSGRPVSDTVLQLALLTGFKVVYAVFQPQVQVGYDPWLFSSKQAF